MKVKWNPCFVLIVADSNVGKEGIVARFVEDRIRITPTTIQCHPERRIPIDGKEITVVCIRECFNTICNQDLRMSNGLIAVYDITSRKTFESMIEMIKSVKERKRDLKIMLIGNKCDLESKREISLEEALSYAKNEGLMFIETSALLSINVFKAFYSLAREIYSCEKNEISNQPSIKPESMDKEIGTSPSYRCF